MEIGEDFFAEHNQHKRNGIRNSFRPFLFFTDQANRNAREDWGEVKRRWGLEEVPQDLEGYQSNPISERRSKKVAKM